MNRVVSWSPYDMLLAKQKTHICPIRLVNGSQTDTDVRQSISL